MNNENNVQVTTPKTKSNKVLMIILILMVVALAGYIAYDKFFSKKMATTATESTTSESTSKSESTSTTENTSEKYVLSNMKFSRWRLEFIMGEPAAIMIDTDGSAYIQYDSAKFTYHEHDYDVTSIKSAEKDYTFSGYATGPMDNTGVFKSVKLDISNVLFAYFVYTGNGGPGYYYIFITSDGSAYSMKLGELKINKIDGVTNAVSVVQSTDYGAHYFSIYDQTGKNCDFKLAE